MVYVDESRWGYGRMKMCHMIGDTLEELHALAGLVGLKEKWFQGDASHPHYDVSKSKRALAVSAGAQEVTSKEMVRIIKRLREEIINEKSRL